MSEKQYRDLEVGEILQEGDEFNDTGTGWRPCLYNIGRCIEPLWVCRYRRPIKFASKEQVAAAAETVNKEFAPAFQKLAESERQEAVVKESLTTDHSSDARNNDWAQKAAFALFSNPNDQIHAEDVIRRAFRGELHL